MKVTCPLCGKGLKVPAETMGKKGRCPACREIITIPAPVAEPQPVPVNPSRTLTPQAMPSATHSCSFCGQPVAAGQVRCNACGQEASSPLAGAAPKATQTQNPGLEAYIPTPPPPPTARRQSLGEERLAPAVQTMPTDYGLGETPPQKTWRSESVGLGIGGVIPATIGAVIGAGLAAVVWVVVAVTTGYEIGWLAILVGAASGWGASMLANEKSPSVGLIAAVIGAAGVIGGSYASFEIMKADFVDEAMVEILEAAKADEEFMARPVEERKQIITDAEAEMRGLGYTDALILSVEESPKDVAFLVIFGLLGLYYGYRVGSGASHR